jgi:hypothetical protein
MTTKRDVREVSVVAKLQILQELALGTNFVAERSPY